MDYQGCSEHNLCSFSPWALEEPLVNLAVFSSDRKMGKETHPCPGSQAVLAKCANLFGMNVTKLGSHDVTLLFAQKDFCA